jgi:hypothetical protein
MNNVITALLTGAVIVLLCVVLLIWRKRIAPKIAAFQDRVFPGPRWTMTPRRLFWISLVIIPFGLIYFCVGVALYVR